MYKLHLILLFIFLNIFIKSQTDDVYTGVDTNKVHEKNKDKKPDSEWKKKVFFGGMIMPGFFNNAFYVVGNPHVGYRATEKISFGLGGNFTYISQRFGSQVYRQTIYGPFGFTRYNFNQAFFLQAQAELLNQQNLISPSSTNERIWIPYVMAGGGYVQRFGDRVASSITVLYNFFPNVLSIYQNPIIQIGFMVGL